MKQCLAYVRFCDGTTQIEHLKLTDNLPFSLQEMNRWRKEKSDKPVKSVKCFPVPKGIHP